MASIAKGRAHNKVVITGTPTTAFPNWDVFRQDVVLGNNGLVPGANVRAVGDLTIEPGATGL